jgi:branched-chain amino acid transport system permease protein
MGFLFTISILICIYSVLALGLNIITGYAGQVNLGHAAFFGIGAYCFAVFTTRYGFSFWSALILSICITVLIGTLLGLPSLRLRRDFLAITTIGMNFVVQSIFLYVEFFGGALGLGGIPYPVLLGYEFSKGAFFALTVALLALSILACRWLVNSWIGLSLQAIREDEDAARGLGVNVTRFKIIAFALGSAFAGLGGSLYASFMTFISPSDFGFSVSILLLSMVVVGGRGTIRGPIFGAIVLGLAPEIFRPIMDYRMLMYGAVLILIMRFQPDGLIGKNSFLWKQVMRLQSSARSLPK